MKNRIFAALALIVCVGLIAAATLFSPSAVNTPANVCQAPTDGVTDAHAAINSCIVLAVAQGWTLTIERPYRVTSPVVFQSNLSIRATSGGCIKQGFQPGTNSGVITQPSFGTPITNVQSHGVYVCGDPAYSYGGNEVALNCSNCVLDGIGGTYAGSAAQGGRTLALVLNQTQVTNPISLFPYPQTGNGAVRVEGCKDSIISAGFIMAGDAALQFGPTASGPNANQDILRCFYIGVGNFSYDGESILAQLSGGGSGSQLWSVSPSNTAGVGTGHSVGDSLTCTGGTFTQACQVQITQVNAGAATQAIVTVNGVYSVIPGATVTMSDGSVWNANFVNASPLSNCIHDSGFIGSPGQVFDGRGVTIGNVFSSGTNAECGGGSRPAIDDITVAHVTIDAASDQQGPQMISVNGADAAHPVGKVLFDDVNLPNPYEQCFVLSGPHRLVTIVHLNCGPQHLSQLGTIAATAYYGATSIAVAPQLCNLIASGDTLAVRLASGMNGSFGERSQFDQASGNCSAGSVSLTNPLVGTAQGGISALYDYSEWVFNIVSTTSAGSPVVCLQSISGLNTSDVFWLVLDSGGVFKSTIASINNSTACITLAGNAPSQASAGNYAADRTNTGAMSAILVKGGDGPVIRDSIIYANNAPAVVLGATSAAGNFVKDALLDNNQYRDVPASTSAVSEPQCDHCRIVGGAVWPTVDSITSNAVGFAAAPPAWTDNLAKALGSGDATMATEAPSNFPYSRSYYAKIDSEIVHVFGGVGTITQSIRRGVLGTAPASHSVGATISVAQSNTTDSPVSGVDVGALGLADCAAAVSGFVAGQGNDVGPLQGCDSDSTSIGSASSFAYTDEFPQIRLTGNTNIASLSVSSTMPPFKTKCVRFYNGGSGTMAISNGSGFRNSGASTNSLTVGGYVPYCFDPRSQTLFQSAGMSAN